MNYGVKILEVIWRHISNVLSQVRHGSDFTPGRVGATPIKINITTDNFVAGVLQDRRHHRADVAQMPRQQYFHDRVLPWLLALINVLNRTPLANFKVSKIMDFRYICLTRVDYRRSDRPDANRALALRNRTCTAIWRRVVGCVA